MRLRLLSPFLLLLVAFALFTTTAAQETTPEGATPTVRPTSQFDLNLPPTQPPSGTATPLPSLTGVGGRAVNSAVAIRSGPGLEYSRVGALALGRSIDIIGYNGYDLSRSCSPNFEADLDMWVMVRFRERTGWIARCTLEIRGEQNLAYMINNAPPSGALPPTGYPVTGTPSGG